MKLPNDLFLVRHGEILDDAARAAMASIKRGVAVPDVKLAHGIPPDRGLTKFGEEQVRLMADWLRTVSPRMFADAEDPNRHQFWVPEYHPENSRCHETNRFLGFPLGVWRESPLLKDRDWGTLGYHMIRDDMRQIHKEAPVPFDWRPGGDGTSMRMLVEQAHAFLRTLRRESPLKSAVISCHGEVLIAFTIAIRGLSPEEFRDLLRAKYFDMPAAVIAHFTTSDGAGASGNGEYRRDRFVCPWNPKFTRNNGAWSTFG